VAIAGMLALVVAFVWLAYRVIVPKQVVVEKVVQVQVPAPETAKSAAGAGKEGAAKGGDGEKATVIAEKDLPPREGGEKGKDGEKSAKGEGKRHGGGSKGGAKEAAKKPTGDEGGKKPIAAIAEPPRPAKGSLDDLLNNAAPKAANRPKVSDDDGKKAGGGGESAGPLQQHALVAGFNAVRPKVGACYNQFKVPGTAMVNVTIGKSGKVSKAEVTGKFAGTPTGQCVEAAVKTASFPPSDGFSTPYPFQLR
jgi:hypothetical protein